MAPFTGSVTRPWARGPSAPPAELPAEVACTAARRTVPSPVSVRKPPRFRGKSWNASPTAYSSEIAVLQAFLKTLRIPRSACHAEGRGFESLQPLLRRPAFAGLFRVISRLMRLRSWGLKADWWGRPNVGALRKTPVCRHFVTTRTSDLRRGWRRSEVRLLGRRPRSGTARIESWVGYVWGFGWRSCQSWETGPVRNP
jgi:hypothetical protein